MYNIPNTTGIPQSHRMAAGLYFLCGKHVYVFEVSFES